MKRLLVVFLITMVTIFTMGNTVHASSLEDLRISGENRWETAVEISQEGWEHADTVVLTTGYNFPDALAGAPLAYMYDAPILLTKNKLDRTTKEEILRLGAKKIFILGNKSAVPLQVEADLKNIGIENIERIGGANRFETAALIAEELGKSDTAFVANGLNFPDALSIAPYAARNGIPILLTKNDTLPDATVKVLQEKRQTIIIGGTAVVGEDVASQLNNPVRYSGKNRFETGKAIVENLTLGSETAYFATGMNFVDALTGSVLAAKHNAPILLVKTNNIPSSTKTLLENYNKKFIIGGKAAVSDIVAKEISGDTSTFTARGISIGDSVKRVLSILGEPDRIDESRAKLEWYIYNSDYSNFLMVGIDNNQVIRLASNADVWNSTIDINIGTTKEVVEQKLVDEYGSGSYYLDDSYFARFYYDEHQDNSIALIELTGEDLEYIDPRKTDSVARDMEKQIFDLANATRVQFGLKPFVWDEKARISSRKHSQDMADRDYFDHINPDGESPVQRMKKEGIEWIGAAENIAAGYYNALDVHIGWMNSYGHRLNILSDLERLGVGVVFGGSYGVYYTQNFYTPR
ncbi:cell wall-binding repeat-containing protein [Ornithinibacillus halophilus]|uniref:Uncharacterized conserved protein YkwD, contains CAP (CSP/antigen 5/PR1) domain n=1 Tax=Ornithinibacillus halophilus TaxID=930117 RepID=A0A1M5HLK4_9BACI|nr:cell wall-binding repeat-containing protein [Ornithinibacillus halophilus]SHG16722.1 Uncharacterized conserved protein YkwD, contains CAP (CSP/antigen 5/PR1) domain [Ornithinibacillus halophilus]